jgi:ankyrin repeat protein
MLALLHRRGVIPILPERALPLLSKIELLCCLARYRLKTLRNDGGFSVHPPVNKRGWRRPRNQECPTGMASSPRTAIAARVLEHGADPEHADSCGMTALMHTASGGHPDTVRLLPQRGADHRARDAKGRSALGRASPFKPEVFASLLGKTGPVDEQGDERQDTPLLRAASAGALDTIKLLLARGAQPQPVGSFRQSALTAAVSLRRHSVVDFLTRARRPRSDALAACRPARVGRDARRRSPGFARTAPPARCRSQCHQQAGETALTRLAASGRTDLLRLLVEAGADVNRETPGSESALSRAVRYGAMDDRYRRPKGLKRDKMAEAVHYLRDQGADPLPGGRSLLHDARALRCPQVVGLLKTAEANRQRLR